MNMDDSLNKIFNLEPVEPTAQQPVAVIESENRQEDDFDLARNTLRDLIHNNSDALSNLINIAKTSESPRAYEVVGQLVKAQADIAKSLLDAHKQKKDLDKDNPEAQKIQTQNNIVFAGSTADLMKMIAAGRSNVIDNKQS